MQLSTIFLASASLFTQIFADTVIPGYTIVDLSWEVEATPGIPPVLLNGTVQEVYAQLLELNPAFEIQHPPIASRHAAPDGRSKLVRRDHTSCGNWPLASKKRILEGYKHLAGILGKPKNGPGPGNCGRVSCSYNSAIWWCNDNTFSKTLNSWYTIAESALIITNDCASGADKVSGQRFHADKWNVIVRGDSC
ncbi:hypothetical protein F5Y14DRAFT_448998 [Nemania sp. NC0429]|nr:hypothetical protein F5Y14DRAFT_448998 [Nemania sp. NC0429]